MPDRWFDYRVRVQPHHTDYGGVVWHGAYVQWLETTRVECLREVGIAFEDLVQLGYDLPVVDMRLRYHQAVQMGTEAIVRTRVAPLSGVRLEWLYQIETRAERSGASQLCLTGQVTLVPIDRHQRKIVRRLPAELKLVFEQIAGYFAESS